MRTWLQQVVLGFEQVIADAIKYREPVLYGLQEFFDETVMVEFFFKSDNFSPKLKFFLNVIFILN